MSDGIPVRQNCEDIGSIIVSYIVILHVETSVELVQK